MQHELGQSEGDHRVFGSVADDPARGFKGGFLDVGDRMQHELGQPEA